MSEEMFLIKAGYNGDFILWWGPNRRGYTTNLDEAGRYTMAEYQDAVPTDKQHEHTLVVAALAEAVAYPAVISSKLARAQSVMAEQRDEEPETSKEPSA